MVSSEIPASVKPIGPYAKFMRLNCWVHPCSFLHTLDLPTSLASRILHLPVALSICITKERLHNRYTALQLAHVCACVTGLQHGQCTNGLKTLRTVTLDPRPFWHHQTDAEMSGQFGTIAEVSRGHFGTDTELSRTPANIFATIGCTEEGLILLVIYYLRRTLVYTRIHNRGLATILVYNN